MSQNSNIEWTEATWNPVRGCTKVSPGCANCYAETFAERWRGVKGHAYEQGFDLRLVPEKLSEPLRRKKPTTYFVNSMSDLFHDGGVPWSFIEQVFDVMQATPQHTYQVLTKRADGMKLFAEYWAFHHNGPLPNVWLGVSVENQHFADERIPLLLQTPAAVRFISAEPLLSDVDLFAFLKTPQRDDCLSILDGIDRNVRNPTPGLDWVIVGGESGPRARSFDLAWARVIVAQCRAAGVPVFVKQLGQWPLSHQNENDRGGQYWVPLYEKRSGVDPTGEYGCEGRGKKGDMAEWPADLRVREMPV